MGSFAQGFKVGPLVFAEILLKFLVSNSLGFVAQLFVNLGSVWVLIPGLNFGILIDQLSLINCSLLLVVQFEWSYQLGDFLGGFALTHSPVFG